MKALWLEHGQPTLRGVPKPVRGPDEALIRIRRAGICATDSALVDGLYAFEGVIGHEFVGLVEDGPASLLGRRVVGEINLPCGRCTHCTSGRAKHCDQRAALGIRAKHGAFAEWITLPCNNLHLVPDDVPDDAAVFAEPLAAAFDILERATLGADDRVLVIGTGKLGQLVARVLSEQPCELHAIGRSDASMARLPASVAIHRVSDGMDNSRYDLVVDCSGSAQGLRTALECVRAQGTIVVKSTYPDLAAIDMSYVVVNEITLVGSRCGPFAKALAFLSHHSDDIRSLIDARFPLDDGVAALNAAKQRGTLKVVLDITSD